MFVLILIFYLSAFIYSFASNSPLISPICESALVQIGNDCGQTNESNSLYIYSDDEIGDCCQLLISVQCIEEQIKDKCTEPDISTVYNVIRDDYYQYCPGPNQCDSGQLSPYYPQNLLYNSIMLTIALLF